MNKTSEKRVIKYFTRFINEGYGTSLAQKLTLKKAGTSIKETAFVISSSAEIKELVHKRKLTRQQWLKK